LAFGLIDDAQIQPLIPLSDHFFTLLPKRFSIFYIKRISSYSFAYGANGRVVRNDAADVAVLAISPSDLFSRSNYCGQTEVAAP
jgi:hypothetical protein